MSQFNSDVPTEPLKPPMPVEQLQSGGKGLAVSSLVLGICFFIPCMGFLTAIIGVILGIVSLAKRRAGKGLAIGGIVIGSVGLVLTPIITVVTLTPAIRYSIEATEKAACACNLHTIRLALQIYSEDKDGKFPPNLQVLVSEDYGLDPEALRCPGVEWSSGKEGGSDYFYMPPLSVDDDSKKIIACDLKSNHRKGRNVLYLDCRVEFLNNEDFHAELQLPCNSAFAEALRKKEQP